MHVYCAYRQTKTCPSNYKEKTLLTPLNIRLISQFSPLSKEKKPKQKMVMFDRQRANSATEKISAKVGVG
jgi:hypothetical protein